MPDTFDSAASDIPKGGWVDRLVPRRVRPYARLARLDRPIGTWLLLFPCWWSIALASIEPGVIVLFALFGLGALVMRGAGCTYNDIVDRDFDKAVARTRDRPLPSGQLTVRQAVVFMVALLAIGLAILLSFNAFAVWVGLASLILVFSYPLMKRFTYWPQFFLGLTFNWGAFLGWAAVTGELSVAAALLYVGGILWTLGYDTIYAHQDKVDDALVGVRSSARALGEGTRPWLYAFYAGAIVLLVAAGIAAGLGWVFAAGAAVGALHLAWQARAVDLDDPKDCLVKFKANRDFGFIVLAAIVLGQLAR
ncbi:MAG: 4-hydroxybenzoate octaprenyltransferase [Alphaproteobacteria bacterium]|nr:4-hydroxybenzoate octaprenyltransferase [Alphaproteobacteria bacterium]